MYRMLLAMALAFAIKDNISRLLEVEGGVKSFETVHWVLVVLTVVMIPFCVMAFISGWKEYQEKRKEDAEAEEARETESTSEKYAELLEEPEEPSEEESGNGAPEEEGASKYDT